MKTFIKILFVSLLLPFTLLSVTSANLYPQELIWKHLGGPMGGCIGDMDLNSQGHIYAGVYTNVFTGQTYEGIYKSTDNGESWFKLENTVDQFEVYAVYVNRWDHIFVGTNYRDRLYRSTDGGETWEIINNGYNTSECWAIGENKDGSVMFAGDGQFGQLYRSTNYGGNWELSSNLPVLSFAVDSSNNIYCGTFVGLYKSTDDGLNWSQVGFNNAAVNAIIIDDGNGVFCGTGYYNNGQGVFYSSDTGNTWTNIGLEDKIVLSLAFTSYGSMLAGTSIDGVFETTNMGTSWTQHNTGLFNKQVFRLKVNSSDDVFVGSEYEGVFRSTNSGESFTQVGLPISGVYNIDFMGDSLILAGTVSGVQKYNRFTKKWENIGQQYVLAVDANEDGSILAGTNGNGLYQSTDLGKSWFNICQTPFVLNVKKINETILAATDTGLIRSTNNGNTWEDTPVQSGVDNCAIEHNNNSDIWVVGNLGKLYKSTDGGLNFQVTEVDFVYADRNNLYVNDNFIFIGDLATEKGINYSIDYGMNWQNKSHNSGNISIGGSYNFVFCSNPDQILYFSKTGLIWDSIPYPENFYGWVKEIEDDLKGKLFFGTSSQGLYEMDFIVSVEEDDVQYPEEFSLNQNYPNPFNSTTMITYSIPKDGLVSLKVFDILGNEVSTLVNEIKPVGNHEVVFVANDFPSGVYFYRLTTENYNQTRKMILLR